MNNAVLNKVIINVIGIAIAITSSGYLQAASFDCAKAGTKIEKLICSDADVSQLDEQLAQDYRTAMKKAKDRDRLKKAQRVWLKEKRNTCKDAVCLKRVYASRNDELTVHLSALNLIIDKPTFELTKGSQYEVCRVFTDYLNSDYYKKGDCTVGNYPSDKRLKSVLYKKANIIDYQEYFISLLEKRVLPSKKELAIKRLKDAYTSGMVGAWLVDISVKNDGSKDFVLITKDYVEKENSCRSLGGRMDKLVNGRIDNSSWDGPLTEPIIFDGQSFLLYAETGGENSYSIYEPRSSDLKHYRENQTYHGDVSVIEICEISSIVRQ